MDQLTSGEPARHRSQRTEEPVLDGPAARVHADGAVWASDEVSSPIRPTREQLREDFFAIIPRLVMHLIQARGRSLVFGPLELLRLGEPEDVENGVRWPIAGGLLARRPGGELRIGWRDGALYSTVDGYRPLLAAFVYRLTQLPFHHGITRLFLLQLRGRRPPPGVVAEPLRRVVAGGIDVALCAAVACSLPRDWRLRGGLAFALAYHLTAWTAFGKTLGGAALGTRLVAIDGSRVTPAQAALRLLWLPVAWRRLRAIHDEAAATELVKS